MDANTNTTANLSVVSNGGKRGGNNFVGDNDVQGDFASSLPSDSAVRGDTIASSADKTRAADATGRSDQKSSQCTSANNRNAPNLQVCSNPSSDTWCPVCGHASPMLWFNPITHLERRAALPPLGSGCRVAG